jgi:Zn-dependent protease
MGGDKSVKDKGYLSLNPVNYMDPTYSILMPMLFLVMGGIGLPGGAVYVDDSRLYNKYWSIAMSLAGPAANLFLAVIIAAALQLDVVRHNPMAPALAFLVLLELSAVVLNLLPIPPLDGYHVMAQFMDWETRAKWDQFAPLGPWVLMGLFWFVPPFNQFFWNIVYAGVSELNVSPSLAYRGLQEFMFWQHR